jgi:hypothetical protein
MTLQPRARTAIALLAAYALALQALFLAGIASASSASLAGVTALPICASAHSSPAGNGQTGHGQDCLDACLTGCCCGVPILPLPPKAAYSAPRPLQVLAAAREADALVLVRAAKAHRSRAPPVA